MTEFNPSLNDQAAESRRQLINQRIKLNLRIFNGFMGFLHLVQAILILYFSNTFAFPVTTSYLKLNQITGEVAPNQVEIFQIPAGPLIAFFLFGSCLAHFTIILPRVYDWYFRNLEKHISYIRWIEYSITSSVMIVVIAMLCGMQDLSSLILIFSLNAMVMLCGLVMERMNQGRQKVSWLAYNLGWLAMVPVWVVVFLYFFGALASRNSIPDYVYYVIISIFVLYNIFALNMFLQYKKIGPWTNYLFGEQFYVVLSLTAKSALAWQIFFNLLK